MAVAAKTKIVRKRLTREESRALTREKILASAYDVMAREGYEGASIDRIAEEAGFSKGAFYSNFSSKEEVFLELLETHSVQDVDEIAKILEKLEDPREMIDAISKWSVMRASDSSWGMLALDLFRRAKHDATFGDRHAHLFRKQWTGLGEILLKLFPKGAAPADPETLGGIVFELTYGAASSFTDGPSVGDLVRLALMSMYDAYGKAADGKRA
ncbi:TetR/AcrR family transcriptional regulator [Mesorhizobium onobrychidis]|uniref:TetR/AcrR family transcriptional regulator n=1 Tax=Mesorhizobium onobrychidis TaxID=2775404 RepID=A0ABY5QVU8_9HYPH|nr:TetR/AcrR family transcriptional regulator [Mesorhizobium onobrychidis]UVC15049.1 TetR/AcrR family transcriptional regulator [Mesorhizobium onobrychidis]